MVAVGTPKILFSVLSDFVLLDVKKIKKLQFDTAISKGYIALVLSILVYEYKFENKPNSKKLLEQT